MIKESFWFYDINILLKNYKIFIPQKNLSLIENLNAIFRFTIIYSLLIYIINNNIEYLYLIPLIGIITIIIYYRIIKKREFYTNIDYSNIELGERPIRNPTLNNPLMNPSYNDYGCNINIPKFNKKIDNDEINKLLVLNDRYYKLPDDEISHNNLIRTFHTIPDILDNKLEKEYKINNKTKKYEDI